MKKVLVVDNEISFKQMMRRWLERYPLDVRTANNGEQGLEFILREEFDLIISDFVMPQMDGIEFFDKCRQQLPEVPFIMLSGFLPTDWNAPGLAFLKKPFPLEELHMLVKEALGD